MGKTTTEFISKLTAHKAKCALCVHNILDAATPLSHYREQMAGFIKQMDAVTEHYIPGGHRPQNFDERVIDNDPRYKKASADYDAVEKRYTALHLKTEEAKKTLKGSLKELSATTDLFDAYVKKKEKAWLGSKNSVPVAKAAIASSRAYITSCNGIA